VSLVLSTEVYDSIITHLTDGMPLEACGLIVGVTDDANGLATVVRFVPSANLSASALVYTIDPKTHLRAERAADDDDLVVLGVVHSHTHSDPYPSPTDVRQAPDPGWHYVIVSLRDPSPALRSYRIVSGSVTEEPVTLTF
jgi:[CysO sulfur-carrier protein]-S-L-cysteine hydrolase